MISPESAMQFCSNVLIYVSCTHQLLQKMTGPWFKIHIDPDVNTQSISTAAPIPKHLVLTDKLGIIRAKLVSYQFYSFQQNTQTT